MLQTLARKDNIESLTGGYGLVVADECHHIPAAAFGQAVKQIPTRRWPGLTATPYRRDKLDDLIALQLGPIRHVITHSTKDASAADDRSPQLELLQPRLTPQPTPVLHLHETRFRCTGEANPSNTGWDGRHLPRPRSGRCPDPSEPAPPSRREYSSNGPPGPPSRTRRRPPRDQLRTPIHNS